MLGYQGWLGCNQTGFESGLDYARGRSALPELCLLYEYSHHHSVKCAEIDCV